MPQIGWFEILVVMILAILIIGPKDFPIMLKKIGSWLASFKKYFTEIDAKEIVIDEFIGQSIPILTIYNFVQKNNVGDFILYTFISFIFFRIFDIVKPFPINKIDQNMKNGFGVILDDIIAGIYSSIVLFVVILSINYV